MILFHGDSYTWGSGLEYHYLVEKLNYTWEQCEEFLPHQTRLEWFKRDIHLYRESNRFSSLVGNHFNVKDIVTSFRNGGDTFTIIDRLETGHSTWDDPNIHLHVVQFSAPTRGIPNNLKNQSIEEITKWQIGKIDSLISNSNWIGLCWFPETAEILKDMFPNKLVTIEHDGIVYDYFEHLTQIEGLSFRSTYGLDDYHFTKKGHQLISDSIIKKINELQIRFETIPN